MWVSGLKKVKIKRHVGEYVGWLDYVGEWIRESKNCKNKRKLCGLVGCALLLVGLCG